MTLPPRPFVDAQNPGRSLRHLPVIPDQADHRVCAGRHANAIGEPRARRFANSKALGSYAGLAATPYSSGAVERERGICKAGNCRLRSLMVELAWLWRRYQPGSAQVAWFRERAEPNGRRIRKIMIVALARKLLIAFWRFVVDGVVPEGAVMKPASA